MKKLVTVTPAEMSWFVKFLETFNDIDDLLREYRAKFGGKMHISTLRKKVTTVRQHHFLKINYINFQDLTTPEIRELTEILVNIIENKRRYVETDMKIVIDDTILKDILAEAFKKVATENYHDIRNIRDMYNNSANRQLIHDCTIKWHEKNPLIQSNINENDIDPLIPNVNEIVISNNKHVIIPTINESKTIPVENLNMENATIKPTSQPTINPIIGNIITENTPNPFIDTSDKYTENEKIINELLSNNKIFNNKTKETIMAFGFYIKSININLTDDRIAEIILLILSDKATNSESYILEQLFNKLNPFIDGSENISVICKQIITGKRISYLSGEFSTTFVIDKK